MEPTPVTPITPAAPAKKSPTPMIIAIIAAAILSLCCCLIGVLDLVSPSIAQSSGMMSGSTSGLSTVYGLVCIGVAIAWWIIPLIVIVVQRNKK